MARCRMGIHISWKIGAARGKMGIHLSCKKSEQYNGYRANVRCKMGTHIHFHAKSSELCNTHT